MVGRQDTSEPERPRRVTLDALLDGNRLAQPVFAPDGQSLAFSAASSFARIGEGPDSEIRIVSREGRLVLRTEGAHDTLPRWSPDGSEVAFISDRGRPGVMGMFILDVGSGSIRPCGEIDGAVEEMIWSPDGGDLLVLAADVGSDRAGVATRIDDRSTPPRDPRVERPSQSWRRLFRVASATGQVMPLVTSVFTVWEIDWTGGDVIAAVMSRDPSESGWYKSCIGVIRLASGDTQVLHTPGWQVGSPRLSPDQQRIAFVEGICSDRGPVSGLVSTVDVPPAAVTDAEPVRSTNAISSDLEVTGLSWHNDQQLWFSGRVGMLSRCGTLSLDGEHHELWRGEAVVRTASASADGRWLVAVKETLAEPCEIALLEVASPEAGWRVVTDLNASLRDLELPAAERISWAAPDGTDIEGLLVRPSAHHGSGPRPLVVIVHGGPTASWSYAFPCGIGHAALLADAGYAVLLPNPRGSSGRGQEFAQAVVGDLGGAELADTLAGVNACVAAGDAEDSRVAIMGASHGGFIAAWAVTQTTRFRAGIAIACVSDYLSLHFTSNIGGLDDILFVGPDRVAAYLERSPIVHVDKCVTPMLIIHGEQDRCCPPSQAQELYGGLVETGTEAELVLYPREGHGYVERDHQIDLWRRVNAWFDDHLVADT